MTTTVILGCLLAWILGGVPFGLVLVRAFLGVDIRRIGSGNVGATNASRAFSGKSRLPIFLLIYVLDFFKGFVPTYWFAAWLGAPAGLLAPLLFGASAVVGHCASPFLKLKGGKGVATTTGVFAALEPIALACAIGVFLLTFLLTRRVYVGSLALGVGLALAVILREPSTAFGPRLPVTVAAIVAALLLFWTHRSNLSRARAARSLGGTSS